MTERVPVTILAGWLGAGKTTLLNSILNEARQGRRLAVLVNDVADVNVDGSLVASHSGDTIELTNGCVCCTIGGSLAVTLRELMLGESPPDAVVIEASGIAEPARVAAYGSRRILDEPRIVTVVDPFSIGATLRLEGYGALAKAQIAQAHALHLSRADLVSPANSRQYEAGLRAIAQIDANDQVATSIDDLGIRVVPMEPEQPSIGSLRERLASTPGLLRAKGVVQTDSGPVLVQWAGGVLETESAPNLPVTGLVVIVSDR